MFVVELGLRPPLAGPVDPDQAALLVEVVRACARREDRIEHVHGVVDGAAVRLTMFLLAGSQCEAEIGARRCAGRLTAPGSPLQGWTLGERTV